MKLKRFSLADAKALCRRDCPYCQEVLARAKKMKRDVLVDTSSWDAMRVARARF